MKNTSRREKERRQADAGNNAGSGARALDGQGTTNNAQSAKEK